jgi:hypothetical protein
MIAVILFRPLLLRDVILQKFIELYLACSKKYEITRQSRMGKFKFGEGSVS